MSAAGSSLSMSRSSDGVLFSVYLGKVDAVSARQVTAIMCTVAAADRGGVSIKCRDDLHHETLQVPEAFSACVCSSQYSSSTHQKLPRRACQYWWMSIGQLAAASAM